MIVLSRSLVSSAMTIGLIPAVVAIAIIIFAANVPIINAQQMTNQPAVSQNGTTLFQSTEDSFRLQVPDGWMINDVNNTGSTLSNESTQGYAILAQLCPQEEEEEEQAALSNVSGRGDTTTSCQGSEGDVIHIVRYPDLDTRLQVPNNITTNNGNLTIDNILSYHMQKLQEVGYRNITIVNSTYTAVNITNAQTNQTVSIVPAKTVEIQYSTAAASSPNQIREGYFILTATNATAPNPGITKGYSVFYEGSSTAPGAATVATIQETTATTATPSGSLEPTLLPALVRHMFESFELIAAPEVIQDMLAAQSEQAQEVPTSPLTVEITSSNTEGEAIVPATFEFEANVGGGTEPYTYSWDFDDEGSTSGEESDEQTVSHTFEEAGSYDVSLTVTDSGGQSASDSVEITVEEEEEEEPIPLPLPVEEEEEEEEPIPPAEEEVQEQRSLADEIAESIEDEVDAFVDDFLSRYGVNN
jgi:PKD repeat protein